MECEYVPHEEKERRVCITWSSRSRDPIREIKERTEKEFDPSVRFAVFLSSFFSKSSSISIREERSEKKQKMCMN